MGGLNRHVFLIILEAGPPRSAPAAVVSAENPPPGLQWPCSHSLLLNQKSHHGVSTLMASSNPHHFPETPLPNIFLLGIRTSTHELGGHKHSVHSALSSLIPPQSIDKMPEKPQKYPLTQQGLQCRHHIKLKQEQTMLRCNSASTLGYVNSLGPRKKNIYPLGKWEYSFGSQCIKGTK